MGYFDGFTDGMFKTDSKGNLLFYPWGVFGKGYVLPNESKKQEVRKFVNLWYSVPLPVFIGIGVGAGWVFILAVLPLVLLWYSFATHRLLQGLPSTSRRLTLRESCASSAKSYRFKFLWSFLGVSFLFALVGFYALFAENDRSMGWVGVFFGLCAFPLGYTIKVKKAGDVIPAPDQKGTSDMDRFFNFKSVELVRIGIGVARITRVTRQKVEYVDDTGREQFVDLEECARIWICLERTGLFPPSDATDWASLTDTTPGFSKLDVSGGGTVGLRGALDSPPWFQFLNRRRTQFEFKNGDSFETKLREPAGKVGWQSFDAC